MFGMIVIMIRSLIWLKFVDNVDGDFVEMFVGVVVIVFVDGFVWVGSIVFVLVVL